MCDCDDDMCVVLMTRWKVWLVVWVNGRQANTIRNYSGYIYVM